MELQTLQEALKVEIQVHQVCCDWLPIHTVLLRRQAQLCVLVKVYSHSKTYPVTPMLYKHTPTAFTNF